jgi:hypothetical protein
MERLNAFMDNGIVFDDRSAILLLLRQKKEFIRTVIRSA